jgi:hypothetical protein
MTGSRLEESLSSALRDFMRLALHDCASTAFGPLLAHAGCNSELQSGHSTVGAIPM